MQSDHNLKPIIHLRLVPKLGKCAAMPPSDFTALNLIAYVLKYIYGQCKKKNTTYSDEQT
jgi:hypothetical protein